MLRQVGIDDNFFDLGGDPLCATRVFARINQAFGMNLTLREILGWSAISALAELVVRSKGTADVSSARITRQPRTLHVIT